MSRDELAPGRGFVPTKESLDFAEQFAERLGLPFDRDAVDALSRSLYEVMFEDLRRVLGMPADAVHFRSGAYGSTRLFFTVDAAGTPVIVLDLVFDYCLAALSHIAGIATFTVPSPAERSKLAKAAAEIFGLFRAPSGFLAVRQRMAPLLASHPEIFEIAHLLARSMTVFALCHEVAHWRLDHLGEPPSPGQEIDADKQASTDFLSLVEHGREDADTHVHVDPKLAGAPIVLMHLLALFESWERQNGHDSAGDSHPPAEQRLDVVEAAIRPTLGETAAELTNGLILGVADLRRDLIG